MGQPPSSDIPASRRTALETFSAALDLLTAAEREPDHWEEECLALAISAMACSLYDVATAEVEAFNTAVRQRSPQAIARSASSPPRFTVARLRHGLKRVRRSDGISTHRQRQGGAGAFEGEGRQVAPAAGGLPDDQRRK